MYGYLFETCIIYVNIITIQVKGRYLISNDIMSVVSKFNKYETCQQKITIPLTNERHALVGSYFYAHVSHFEFWYGWRDIIWYKIFFSKLDDLILF